MTAPQHASSSTGATTTTCPYAKLVSPITSSSIDKKNEINEEDRRGRSSNSNSNDNGGEQQGEQRLHSQNKNDDDDDEAHLRQVREALELARTSCPAFRPRGGSGSGGEDKNGNKKCPFRDSHTAEELARTMMTVPPSHLRDSIGSSGGGGCSSTTSLSQGEDGGLTGTEGGGGGAPPMEDVSVQFKLALEHVHMISQDLHHSSVTMTTDAPSLTAASETDHHDETSSDNHNHHHDHHASSTYVIEGGCPFKTIYKRRRSSTTSAAARTATNMDDDDVPFVQALEGLSLAAIMAELARGHHHHEEEEEDEEEEDGSSKKKYEEEEDSIPAKEDAIPPPTTTTAAAAPAPQAPPAAADAITTTTTVTTPTTPTTPTTTATTPTTTTTRLSLALKRGTTASHKAAENVQFVRNFIKGQIQLSLYKRLVIDLYHVYTALEEELQSCSSGAIWKPLHKPYQLDRRTALRADMDYFFGSHWERNEGCPEHSMSDATRDYVHRIHHVAQHEPLLLVAHAYTRYLGDLSGGRVLQRVARKALSLPSDGSGLDFYDFVNIPEGPKEFKTWYRHTLDSLPLSAKQVRLVVAEANVAFVLNMRLFEELDVLAGEESAVVRPLEDALGYYDRALLEEEEGRGGGSEGSDDAKAAATAKCPFITMGGGGDKSKTKKKPTPSQADMDKCPAMKRKAAAASATTTTTTHDGATKAAAAADGGGRCPWPFVFFHDPIQGLCDYQTWWVVLCLACLWAYRASIMSSSAVE